MIKDTAAHTGLLKTKYSKPGSNKHLLPRQVLNHKLNDSLNHKLTLITAPAGYGKTTAVLKWLEMITLPVAWLSLDTDDNDALVFWRYFCAALDSILGGISKNTDYVFASQELWQANVHLSILIDNLSSIHSDFLFILDDIHLIKNQAILNELSYFITYLPPNLHLTLISRTAPQLKLAKLGLKEALVRINTKDLRFNSVEIYQYYQARGYFLQKVIGECENRMEKFQKPHWSYMLTAFKVRLYIDLDDNEKLEQWLMESRLSLYQDIIRTREYELIVLARVLIARKRYGDAQLLLNRLLNFAEGLKRSHSIVEITNLLAITAMKNSNTGLTEKHFENALAIGIKESGVNFLQGIETELDSIIQFCFYTYIFGPPISA